MSTRVIGDVIGDVATCQSVMSSLVIGDATTCQSVMPQRVIGDITTVFASTIETSGSCLTCYSVSNKILT